MRKKTSPRPAALAALASLLLPAGCQPPAAAPPRPPTICEAAAPNESNLDAQALASFDACRKALPAGRRGDEEWILADYDLVRTQSLVKPFTGAMLIDRGLYIGGKLSENIRYGVSLVYLDGAWRTTQIQRQATTFLDGNVLNQRPPEEVPLTDPQHAEIRKLLALP